MTEPMTNADLLRRALAMTAGADPADAASVLANDVVFITPGFTVTSRAALLDELADRDEFLGEMRVEIRSLVTEKDRGFAEWTVAGQLIGAVALDDEVLVEAAGQPICLEGATVARFADGKIIEMRQYWNEVDLLEELGLLPED